MSYCRFGDDSDVYVYATFDGKWIIHSPIPSTSSESRQECLQRMLDLSKAGHKVPQYAINRLQEEIELEDSE